MDGEVQLFDVLPANQEIVGNPYDEDNFYPSEVSEFNGTGEYGTGGGGSWADDTGSVFETEIDLDSDYSELFGMDFSKFKDSSKKKGGKGFFKTLGEVVSGRGGGKTKRFDERERKRTERRTERTRRKNIRQQRKMANLPPETKQKLGAVARTNPPVNVSAGNMKMGVASPPQEQLIETLVPALEQGGAALEDLGAGLGLDLSAVTNGGTGGGGTGGGLGLGEGDGKDKKEKGWASLSTGAKIGIGVGGALVLGGIVFAIVKMSSKKSK
jgi:hypothetical protein